MNNSFKKKQNIEKKPQKKEKNKNKLQVQLGPYFDLVRPTNSVQDEIVFLTVTLSEGAIGSKRKERIIV